MKLSLIFLLVYLVLLASLFWYLGFADSVSVQQCVATEPSGFWWGLWHGIIMPYSFIGSLFIDSISMYDINNNGGWYDFGYILGVSYTMETVLVKYYSK